MSLLQGGDTFLLKRTPQQDDFYHLMNGKFCGEAWDAVSRYVYTALQITVPNKSHFLDTVTNAITKGVIKKYNKPTMTGTNKPLEIQNNTFEIFSMI